MKLRKPMENSTLIGDHWEWQDLDYTIHSWTDKEGRLHSEGSPAEIGYREDGTIAWESWWFHGELHREGAPAKIGYHNSGTISWESWWIRGESSQYLYSVKFYQSLQNQIGRETLWRLIGVTKNLFPFLLGFLQ